MAGHSKWAQIKHKKAKVDAQKGKRFAKLIREIQVAARIGGPDPDLNPRLRLAIDRARAANMPMDNIERAIKKATGGEEGTGFEETIYEGYGPGGVAIMIVALTDNKNRTTGEVRHVLTKYGGNLGKSGTVAWQFAEKGVIYVEKAGAEEEDVLTVAADAGAEDFKSLSDTYEITTEVRNFGAVRAAVEAAGFVVSSAEITRVPKNTIRVEGNEAERLLKLMEALEDLDDVQDVYANFDIPEEVLEALA
ncbi:MAG: YebC/PmpR family DNA-binding transcriptional regulator [candidate division WOR-3 bacterium]